MIKRFLLSMQKKFYIRDIDSQKLTFDKVLDFVVLFFFGFTFFSIPAFSFSSKGKYITWALTVFLLLAMMLSLCKKRKIHFDIISLSFPIFVVSALISSALNGFTAFKITAYLLAILSFFFYVYFRNVKNEINLKAFIFVALLATTVFLFTYVIKYRHELLSLSFNRLGALFGDENDIALFLSFGMSCSFYYAFERNKHHIIFRICFLIIGLLFAFCGFTTGSKIFVFVLMLCLIFIPFYFFGKKKWWLALLTISIAIALFILVLNIPALSAIKKRLMSFLSTIFGKSVDGGSTGELSTINRFGMFLSGMQLWLKRPMFGWGSWGFATYGGAGQGWSHNNISETFCNFGLIGTVLFHFGFVSSFVYFSKMEQNYKKEKYLSLFLLMFYCVAMLGVALNSQKLYAFIVGILIADMCHTKNIMCIDLDIVLDKFFKRKVLG